MLSDISVVDSTRSILVKFADDLTLSTIGWKEDDMADREVLNVMRWAKDNCIKINIKKTKALVVRGRADTPAPKAICNIEHVSEIKLLGIHFHSNPTYIDSQF